MSVYQQIRVPLPTSVPNAISCRRLDRKTRMRVRDALGLPVVPEV